MAKGSIEKRGEYTWRLRIDLGYLPDGTRNRPPKTISIDDPLLMKASAKCSKYKDAKGKLKEFLDDELAKFKLEVQASNYIKPQKMSLDQFIKKEWVPKYASDPDNLAPLTYVTYQRHIDNHISPALGHMLLGDITTMHCLTFIKNLSKPGMRKDGRGEVLSKGTIGYIYRVLKNIFARATEWKLIKENPMIGVKKPTEEQTEFEFYDEGEAAEVIAALNTEVRKWRLFVLGSMIGGCRRGELVALQWPEVDFENMTIQVKKSISLTENSQAVEKGPKSKSSKRTIDMPVWYMSELEQHHKEWLRQKDEVGGKWQGGDNQYVFHGGYGKPYYYSYPSKWWGDFVRRHGLKYVRFHDLRHSSATLLIEAGASLKAIQKRLGHSKHQTTADIYAHVTKKLSRDTAEKFDKFAPQNIRPQFVPNTENK